MKKGFRQLLSILTTLVMLCGALPTGAFAEETQEPSTSYSEQVALPVVPKATDAPDDAVTQVTVRFAFGEQTFDLTVDRGATVDTEKQGPDPTRDGYVFTGWNLDGQTVSILEDVQQDTTLMAQYVQLFTITFENWDGTVLAKVPSVRGGTQFTSDAYYDGTRVNPSRDGYRFLRWEPETIESVDGDATIKAVFSALVQHTVTINYVFENQRQAESPFVATVSDGYSLEQTVPSPAVQGYSPAAGQESITLTGTVTEDQTYTVLYLPNGSTRYEVHYLLQNLTDDGYTLDATHTEIRSGVTGSMTDVQADHIQTFTGFTLVTDLRDVNDAIAADESTVIELRYNRDVHFVVFDTADGEYIAPQVDRYGTPVREYTLHTSPTRTGYSFLGWDKNIPATIGTEDVTITALWKANRVPYTVVFWIQNPDDDNYSYAGYKTITDNWWDWSSKTAGTVLSSPGAYYDGPLQSYVNLRSQNPCDTVTIKGDGSTVQNVYYDRNLYTLYFDLNSNNSNLYLVANGTEYYAKNGISYKIRARYDANILSLWPSSVSDSSFQGWDCGVRNASLFASKRPTLNAELLDSSNNGYTFTAKYRGKITNTLVYILEDTHGNFVQDHSLDQVIASPDTDWGAKKISGFTNIAIDQGTVRNGACTRTFTYSRNKVNLRLKNGDTITTESDIYFGASLAPYADKYAAPSRPTGIDPDYIFTGWYTEAGCNDASRLDWATAVMPFDGLMLYAGWKNPTYMLTFYLQDPQTELYQTQTVERKGIATTLAAPTRDGYQFDYWYYRDPQSGLTKLYNFSMPITQTLELYAHWSPKTVAYTVQYVDEKGRPVYDETGKNALAAKTGSAKVGELVTEMAVSAYSSSKTALFPESVSSSITLQSDSATNVITFRYHELQSVYYLVRYVDEGGNELHASKGPISTTQTRVTENYLNINGFSPDVYQQTVMLAGETDEQQITENVIIFTYHPNPKGAYQVRYYLQNLNDNGYTLQETQAMSDAPLGSTAHAEIRTYEGFYYVPGLSVSSGVVYSSTTTPLILSVYYNRKLIAYSAAYWDHDATPAVKIAEDSVGYARYGRSVTLYAKSISGYTLDAAAVASPVTLTMQADETLNHVDFYYNVQEGLAVTIRFLDESGTAIADPISVTGKQNQNVRLNATFGYTLADLQRTIRYQSTETFRLRSDESAEKSVTVTAGENYIDYHYVPDTFHVTYDANGGANAPTDGSAYRVNVLVTLATDAPTYGEYRFEGWSLNEAVRGQVYRTAEALQAAEAWRIDGSFRMPEADQTLYAVWSYIDVTLSYRSEEPYTGTLPAAHTVPVQQPTAVAGNDTFARAGYTFSGWKQHDTAGNPIGLAYGTGSGMTREIVLQADTVLYATWSPVGYAITYQSNLPEGALARLNWNGAPATYTVESTPITLPTLTCSGYIFDGWYLDSNGTVAASTPAIPARSTGERTFYARFSPAQVQSFRIDNYNGTYDGRAHGIAFHADAMFDGDTVSFNPANAFIHVTDTPQSVTVTVRRDQVVIWSGTGTVQIGKRAATLTAESINELYNGSAYTLAVQVGQGAANEADRAAILASLTFTRQGTPVENSFTDAMTQTTIMVSASHPDYTITPAEPTVAIRKRPLTVTGETRSFPYDGQEHALENWTVEAPTATTGLVGSDAVSGVYWSGNSRTEVGTSYPAITGLTLSTGNPANYQPTLNAGTLTVTRRSDLTLNLTAGTGTYLYDGLAHGFETDTAGVPVTLSYRLKGAAWKQVDAEHPLPSFTNAGTYTLQVKAESPNYDNVPTDEATLTIQKRTVHVLGGTLTHAYNGSEYTLTSWSVVPTDATSGVVGSDTITEVKWTNNKRTVPGTVSPTLSVSDWSEGSNPDNYELETTPGTLTVTANTDAPQLTAPDVTLLYDDRPHRLTYTVNVPDDCPYTLYYRTSTDNPWTALRKNDPLPQQTEAGEYPIYLRLISDYYTQTNEMTATLHILRRPLLLSVVSETREGYNGKPVTAEYTVEPESETGGLLIFHQLEATLLNATQTAAGTYIVTFLESDTYIRHGNKNVTANYDIQYKSGQIVIGSAASQSSATQKTAVYDGTAQTFTAPVLLDAAGKAVTNVTLAWSLVNLAADAPGWQATPLPTETEVKGYEADGTTATAYQIYVRLSNPNYQSAVVTASLRIDPAAVTLTADSSMNNPYTLNADGTAKTWSVTTAHWAVAGLAQDLLYAGDQIFYTLRNNTQSDVGDGHAVTFSAYGVQPAAHAKNYRITPVDGWIRVVRSTAQATLAHPGLTFTYDAQPHTLPMPTVSVATEGGLPVDRTVNYTFQYTVTHNGVDTVLTQLPTFTEAGAYSVTIRASSTVYANPEPFTLTVTVDRRMLTLTSGTVQATYDALPHSAPILTLVSNYAPGTNHAVRADALTLLAGQTATATLAGVYPVQIDTQSVRVFSGTTEVTANYQFASVAGSLTITAATVPAGTLPMENVTVVYDGTAHSLTPPDTYTLNGVSLDLTDPQRFTVAWQEKDAADPAAVWSDSPANPSYINASMHDVRMVITDLTNSLAFAPLTGRVTIAKRRVTITPNSDAFDYDGTQHTVLGHDNPAAQPGSDTGFVQGDYATVTLLNNRQTDAGTYEISWQNPASLTRGDLDNYTLVHATGTLTIRQATSLSLQVQPQSGVYDGQTHSYTFTTAEPNAQKLTLAYSLDNTLWTTFTDAADLPTAVDAGEYQVWIRASSPNFANEATQQATLQITARPVTLAPQSAGFDYDGTAKSLSVCTVERAVLDAQQSPLNATGLLGTDEITVSWNGNSAVDAGVYAVTCGVGTALGNTKLTNYAFQSQTGSLTIRKVANPGFTLTAEPAVYDAQPHGFAFATTAVGAYTLEYSTDGLNWTAFTTAAQLPTRTDAGTLQLTVRLTNSNYTTPAATGSALLSIERRPLTLTVAGSKLAYDGQPHSLQLTASGLATGDALETYQLNPASATKPGSTVMQVVEGNTVISNATRTGNQIANYTVTPVEGILTLIDLVLTPYNGIYDGQAHGVTAAWSESYADHYTLTYTVDGVAVDGEPSLVNAGTYAILATAVPKDATEGLPSLTRQAMVQIASRVISLQVAPIQKTYDGIDASLQITLPVNTAANQSDADTLLNNVRVLERGVEIRNHFLNAGTWNLTVDSTCDNYTVTPVAANVNIARRPLTITAGSASKVYDEQPVTVGYTYNTAQYNGTAVLNTEGLLKQHTLTAVLQNQTQTDICNQVAVTFQEALTSILDGTTLVRDNYMISYQPGHITITQPALLTLALSGVQTVYDGQPHAVEVVSVMDGTRSVATDRFNWSFGLSADAVNDAQLTRTDVCDLTIYVVGHSKDLNYPNVSGSAKLTITARPVSIQVGNLETTYDGQPKSITAYTPERAQSSGARGLLGTDQVSVTLTNATQTLPGTYEVGWENPQMTSGAASNYQFEEGKGWLSILKASQGLRIAAEDTEPVYDALAHRLAYTVTAPAGCLYTVEYSTDNGQHYQSVGTDGLLPALTQADSVSYLLRVTSPYYVDGYSSTAQATLTVRKRPLTVTGETNSFPYDTLEHTVNGLQTIGATTAQSGLVNDGAGTVHRIADFAYAPGLGNTQTVVGGHAVRVLESSLVIRDQANADVTANYSFTLNDGRIDVTAQQTGMTATTRSAVYNGQPQGFTPPTLLDASGSPVTEPVSYQYSTDGILWSTTPVTYENVRVGSPYTISIRAVSPNYAPATVNATLDIQPAPLTVAVDSTQTFVYALDGSGEPVEWTLNRVTTAGTLYKGETIAAQFGNNTRSDVGSQPVTLQAAQVMLGTVDVSANYTLTLVNGTLTVFQGTADAYLLSTPLEQTYNGTAYTLPQPKVYVQTQTGDYLDRTANYSFQYSITKMGSSEVRTVSNTLPTFRDAGTYTVAITATSTRLTSPVTGSATVEIAKRPVSIGSGDNRTAPYTYNAAEQSVVAALVTGGSLALNDALGTPLFSAGFENTATDVCDRAVTLTSVRIVRGSEDVTDNYTITLGGGWMQILPKPVSDGLTLTGVTHVYNGGSFQTTLSDTLQTGLGALSLSGAQLTDGSARFSVIYRATANGVTTDYGATVPQFTDASAQTITALVTDHSGNLTISPASATVEITPRPVTITPDSDTLAYDGLGHSITTYQPTLAAMGTDGIALGNSGFVGSDRATVTLQNAGPHTLPGQYSVTWAEPVSMSVGKAGNYQLQHASGLLTIEKATGLQMELTADSATYDGLAHGFTVLPKVPTGCPTKLEYRLLGGTWITVTAATPLPTYVHAGTYAVELRLTSDYYTDTALETLTLTIAPRELTLASGNNTATPYIYTGSEQSVTAAYVSAGSLADGDGVDQTSLIFVPGKTNASTDACDRAVTLLSAVIRNAEGSVVNSDYNMQMLSGWLRIRKAPSATASVTRSATYTGSPVAFATPELKDAAGNLLTGVSYAYSLSPLTESDPGWTEAATLPTRSDVNRGADGAVNAYTLYVRITHPNYATQITQSQLTIQPAPLTLTAESNTGFVYTLDSKGEPIEWSVSDASVTAGSLYMGATVDYTLRDYTQTTVGSHAVWVDTYAIRIGAVEVTDNYAVTLVPGTIRVSRGTAQSTLTAYGDTVTYDGQPHGVRAPVVSVLQEDGVAAERTRDFTLTYDVALQGTDRTWHTTDLTDVAFTDAGTYQITVSAASDLHATPNSATVTLLIQKRALHVQSEDNRTTPLTYNGRAQSVDGAQHIIGLVDGQNLTELTYVAGQENAATDAVSRMVQGNGAQVLDGRTNVTANYTLYFDPGWITILPLPIDAADIPITGVIAEYDGLAHSVTLPRTVRTDLGTLTLADEFTIAYLNGDTGTTGSENPGFTEAGVHTVTVSFTSLSGNYVAPQRQGRVNLSKRVLTIRYGTLRVAYDGLEHTVDRTVTGLAETDALAVIEPNRMKTNATRLTGGAFGALTVDAEHVTLTAATDATVDRSGNYTVGTAPGMLEITPLPLEITATSESHVYRGSPYTLSGYSQRGSTAAGQTVGVTFRNAQALHVVDRQPVEIAGVTVTVDASGEDVTANYQITTSGATLTITPAPLVLKVTDSSFAYDGLSHQPAAFAVSGLQGNDKLSAYSLLNMPQTGTGVYANVGFDPKATLLLNADGTNVTGDYTITYRTGSLEIYIPLAAFTVQYFYDGVLDPNGTATYYGIVGQTVTSYPSRRLTGYTLSYTENLPLELSANGAQNVINVYYRTANRLLTLDDLAVPLGFSGGSLEVGITAE